MTSLAFVPAKAQPWRERSGRLSWLKLIVFIALFVPGLGIAVGWWLGWLQPKPVTEAIHGTGEWAVRFLVLSLAITPLRRIVQWNRLILVRRMLGLAALAYILMHFALYTLSLHFDLERVASEIVLRIYLTIGFVALVGLCLLGVTSTDAMIRRIGPQRWTRLHRLVYGITVLGLLHYFLQAKIDVTAPTLVAGLFLLLMGQRLLQRVRLGDNAFALAGLALAAGLLTALLEAGWYGVASGVPADRVLDANLDFSDTIRPAWWVLGVGSALVVLRLLRIVWSGKPRLAPSNTPVAAKT